MLTLLCAACALPAWAGSWSGPVYTGTVTENGGTPSPLTPKAPGLNYYKLWHGDASVTAVFTATFTWVHSDPNNPGADPPPAQLSLLATGTASWQSIAPASGPAPTGACSDGLGDTATDATVNIPPNGNFPAYTQTSGQEGGTWVKVVSGSSGTATLTVNPSGMAQRSGTTQGDPISFTLSVAPPGSAIPVNWRLKQPGTANADGTLSWLYIWSSSDGVMSDLTNYWVHERVTYSSNPNNTYVFPPPFVGAPNDPTITPSQTDNGSTGMTVGFPDTQNVVSTAPPYVSATVTATQYFLYTDLLTGNTVTLSGPYTITRSVGPRIPYVGTWYSCSKSDLTAYLQLD